MKMEIERIRNLPKVERLAGYLARLAAIDEYGAKLRAEKEDNEWDDNERSIWDNHCDLLDPWFHALTEEERELIRPIENFMACLCRGEDPQQHIRLVQEFVESGKYKKKE